VIFIGIKLALEMIPQVLNGIEVGGLSRPVKDMDLMVLEPIPGSGRCVLGVTILLEDKAGSVKTMVASCREKIPIKNLDVGLSIYNSID
jgi:hypothetical protein